MKNNYLIVISTLSLLLSFSSVSAQNTWQEIIERETPEDLPLASELYQIGKLAKSNPNEYAERVGQFNHFKMNGNRIFVELEHMNANHDFGKTRFTDSRIEIIDAWHNLAAGYIEVNNIISFAQDYKSELVIRNVDVGSIQNEGPTVMNSGSYNINGNGGAGVKIAIIDLTFQGLSAAQLSGDIANAVLTPLGGLNNAMDTDPHGTACLEAAFDHAPAATYYAFKKGSHANLGNVIDYCILNDIDIISYSVSSFNTGWGDNEGPVCQAFNSAAQNGILCFVAAGNYADNQHYQSSWNDPDGNDWHNFSGGDETNHMTVDSGQTIRLSLQFAAGPDAIADDYDLYLYNDENDQVLASSTNCCDFEIIEWTNNLSTAVGDMQTVYWAVKNDGTDENAFEVFSRENGALQYQTPQSSATSPSNCTQPNVVCVGAVDQWDYSTTEGDSGINSDYSSQGPSNSGMLQPDICAPTETTSIFYGGRFNGTSCATPNAAGMAAAFWSKNANLSADGVRKVLFKLADMYADYGASGHDNIYGKGGLYLHDYQPNTRYILSSSGNSTGTATLPYTSITQADQFSSSGRNMMFLGETFPAVQTGILADKAMVYRSVKNKSTVK